MADYTRVSEALKSGADPAVLCTTCPWDRFCITPPTMTSEEVRAHLDEASAKDKAEAEAAEARGEKPRMPVGTLVAALAIGGRDTQSQMKAWDDGAVSNA